MVHSAIRTSQAPRTPAGRRRRPRPRHRDRRRGTEGFLDGIVEPWVARRRPDRSRRRWTRGPGRRPAQRGSF